MPGDLASNYFELFGIPPGFDVDGETLALRYRDLQRVLHPDRYAGASDQERRISVQQAARVNEGFRVLKSPLARARYLLELHGFALDETDTSMDPAFLMEQMEFREEIGEIPQSPSPFAALEQVRTRIEERDRRIIEQLGQLFSRGDEGAALQQARQETRKLQFIKRLLDEVDELEDELVHTAETPD